MQPPEYDFQPDFRSPPDPLRSSPDGRFIRSEDRLGQGSTKIVYRGIDTFNGTEVAFNLVDLERLDQCQTQNLFDEVQLLRRIDSPYIISFYDVWLAPYGTDIRGATHLVFVTELMGSGTIGQYLQRAKRVNLATIKRWCAQILQGLQYLHTLDPPVLHRDVKPDNIFLNTNLAHTAQGEVKIGDLGLSRAVSSDALAHTIAGTPEFMAPECFDGSYDVRADIYAFGLTLLEMCTFQYPYKECRGAIGVYRRVSEGIPPESLQLVTHKPTHDVIELCIGPVNQRPSASQLLADAWLKPNPLDVSVFFTPNGQVEMPVFTQSSGSSHNIVARGSAICQLSTPATMQSNRAPPPLMAATQPHVQRMTGMSRMSASSSYSQPVQPMSARTWNNASTEERPILSMALPPAIAPPPMGKAESPQLAPQPPDVISSHNQVTPRLQIERNILSMGQPPPLPQPTLAPPQPASAAAMLPCEFSSGSTHTTPLDPFAQPPQVPFCPQNSIRSRFQLFDPGKQRIAVELAESRVPPLRRR